MWVPRRHARYWIAGLGLLLAGLGAPARSDAQVTLTAVMIHASNQPAPIDRRLENIEYRLRKIFGFEHYKHAGEGSLTLNLPGEGTIQLGSGYSLHVKASGQDGRIRTQVRWRQGDTTLLSTTTVVSRRVPTVLGGATHGDGKMIVTLVIR